MDCVKYRFCRHKSSTAVNNKVTSRLVLIGRCLESAPNLHIKFTNIDGERWVKESWSLSELQKTSFTHCLLDNHIKYLAHSLAILSVRVFNIRCIDSVLSIKIDFQSYFLAHKLGCNKEALFNLLSCPNIKSGINELTSQKFNSGSFFFYDLRDFKWCEFINIIIL